MGFFDSEHPISPKKKYEHNSSKGHDDNTGWTRKRGTQPKFMPLQKEGDDLFDKAYHIREGPKFQEQFGKKAESSIHVTGGDGKYPIIDDFDECNFTEEIRNNLKSLEHIQPLPIQKCVIPLIQYKDGDIIGHARTGSGKTLAFMLPIVNEIQLYKEEHNISKNQGFPLAIIIAPTKELGQQLCDDIRGFAHGTNVDVFVSYGDMPFGANCRQIKTNGCDIFVGTCGRVHHFVREQIVKLDDLRYFILDEADKLLHDSFFEEIRAIKHGKNINPHHRMLMFSATFDGDVQSKFEELVRPDYYFVSVGDMNQVVDTVQQEFLEVTRYEKYDALVDLLLIDATPVDNSDQLALYDVKKTMIFVQHKREADRVAIHLALKGFKVISTSGDRTLEQRTDAKENFIRGVYQILVATNVAARGLNFPDVQHIINFDLPEQELLTYVHRIGRSGRAGNVGRATSFFDPGNDKDCQNALFYYQTLKEIKQEVPKFLEEIVAMQENSNALEDDSKQH